MCSGGASGSARERKCGARDERQYIARLPECECNGAWHLTDLRHREWWHRKWRHPTREAASQAVAASQAAAIASGGITTDRQGHTDDEAT